LTSNVVTAAAALALMGTLATQTQSQSQAPRPPSPNGTSSTQIGGAYGDGAEIRKSVADPKLRAYYFTRGPIHEGGQWIDITYGRPIKRGRDLWGSGADYGKNLNAGAPVWRAGANVTTRLNTEVPIVINGKAVAPGEYSLFIDLKPNNWTLIVSTWAPQTEFDPNNKTSVWGSYNYTPDKDVLRAPMKLETLRHSIDELTWNFADMTDRAGVMMLMWDTMMASVPFEIGK
jgi:hypothetical protein